MAQHDETLIEIATRHQVHLERLKTQSVNENARFLKEMDKAVSGRLAGKDLTAFKRGRLEKLIVSVRGDLNVINKELNQQIAKQALDLAEYEAGFEIRSLEQVVKSEFTVPTATGPTGAMAHHRPSDSKIQRGEPIVIDMGARVGGYCSDITRTVLVGEPDETFRKIYDIVLGAQLTAINTVRPGMTGEECDGLSRGVIAEAGYGDNFGHSLGHGVGLLVHENPRVSPKATEPLEPDMVFTVEPGIYITGWGGVRIEDIVVLGDQGATPLSKASK